MITYRYISNIICDDSLLCSETFRNKLKTKFGKDFQVKNGKQECAITIHHLPNAHIIKVHLFEGTEKMVKGVTSIKYTNPPTKSQIQIQI